MLLVNAPKSCTQRWTRTLTAIFHPCRLRPESLCLFSGKATFVTVVSVPCWSVFDLPEEPLVEPAPKIVERDQRTVAIPHEQTRATFLHPRAHLPPRFPTSSRHDQTHHTRPRRRNLSLVLRRLPTTSHSLQCAAYQSYARRLRNGAPKAP